MIIVRRRGGVTAKNLALACGCKTTKNLTPLQNKFIINYGAKCEYANLNKNVDFNKHRQLIELQQGGIPVPEVFNRGANIDENKFPIIGRCLHHSGGRDIIFFETKRDLQRHRGDDYDFLVKYIKKNGEYRVHILGDVATICSVKINSDENANKEIRCRDNGWKQINYSGEFKEEIINLAKKTLRVLKYDFGSVDIIRTKRNSFYVLEVNSNSGLEERKLQIYADYFKEMERRWSTTNRRGITRRYRTY